MEDHMQIDPQPATYEELRDHVSELMREGHLQSKQASERERVDTYWHVGDSIIKHISRRPGDSGYGDQIVANLASDLNLGTTRLYQLLAFRRAFSNLHSCVNLTWSHYRVLTALPSVEQRRFYQRAADEAGWTSSELENRIKADLFQRAMKASEVDDPSAPESLRARRGPIHAYRLRHLPATIVREQRCLLDLGFGIYRGVTRGGSSEGASVQVVLSRKRRGADSYVFTPHEGRTHRYFTNIAYVERVIDGDTLLVWVDCGFGMWTRRRLRLRGIDAAELSRTAGQLARDFVSDQMASVPFVVITTSRPGKYGRYLADVFYEAGESDPEVVAGKGRFLNRELLRKKLARKYGD